MREEHIIDALNLLDTDIIEETDAIRSNPIRSKPERIRKHTWKWWLQLQPLPLPVSPW